MPGGCQVGSANGEGWHLHPRDCAAKAGFPSGNPWRVVGSMYSWMGEHRQTSGDAVVCLFFVFCFFNLQTLHTCIHAYITSFHASMLPCVHLYANMRPSIHIRTYVTLHYITLHTTLCYITLHYITLHYITLHYTTLHYTTLHCTTLHYTTLHCIALHYRHYIHYIHCMQYIHYIHICIPLHTYIHTYMPTYLHRSIGT